MVFYSTGTEQLKKPPIVDRKGAQSIEQNTRRRRCVRPHFFFNFVISDLSQARRSWMGREFGAEW